MTVAISRLTIDWGEFRPKRKDQTGAGGRVEVSESGVTVIAPRPDYDGSDYMPVLYREAKVDPADLDALILALQRARDLGRQMFNSEVKP